MTYVVHPRIIPDTVEERRYQVNMARACLKQSTLVVLPTGLGKTIVALHVIADRLEKGKVLILAPTKPLVDQHMKFFSPMLVDTKVASINGLMKPDTRIKVIRENDVIIGTPQAVANDLESGRYGLDGFSLVIFDEAHRGTGNYAYVTVAKYVDTLTLGLTASPGSDVAKVEEICDNLLFDHIEVRTDDDPDVSPYIFDTYINRIHVDMPSDLLEIISRLRSLLNGYYRELVNLHLADPNWPMSTKHMLSVGETIRKRMARGERTATVFRGLTVQTICVKLLHAMGLAETQGMTSLRSYLVKLKEDAGPDGSKGSREIMARKEFREVLEIASTSKVEHPKVPKVLALVCGCLEVPGRKAMVFTQYRDTCDLLAEKISGISGAKVAKLTGQSNGGLKQKEQIALLDAFRKGDYNVLVSTSVGEEGLDIAYTDTVIFYEPVPSEIRTIQRRGRTGRKNDGEVHILMAKGTMDEVFEESSNRKEEQMRTRLLSLNTRLGTRRPKRSQKGLYDF